MKKVFKIIALLMIIAVFLTAVSCAESESPYPEENSDGSTVKETEKTTKKRPAKGETEAPTVIEDVSGLDLDIKVLTQNLSRMDRSNGNSIALRAERFGVMLEDTAPDLIGTQEASLEWVGYLKKLGNYGFVGVSSAGERAMYGEWNAVLYKKDRFVLMDDGTFWLSEDPRTASRLNGSMDYRTCTWAELFDRYTGKTVIMASAQLDGGSEELRSEQARVLILYLKSVLGKRYNSCQIYISADLNAMEYDASYRRIIRDYYDTRDIADEELSELNGTYHAFGNIPEGKETDFCFTNGGEVLSYCIIDKKYAGSFETEPGFVSDHYGIMVTFGGNR